MGDMNREGPGGRSSGECMGHEQGKRAVGMTREVHLAGLAKLAVNWPCWCSAAPTVAFSCLAALAAVLCVHIQYGRVYVPAVHSSRLGRPGWPHRHQSHIGPV
jgi:hypothetical protein